MRPVRVSLPMGATGFSQPILHDTWQTPAGITLSITWSNNQAGSPVSAVQYTIDDLSPAAARSVASISRAGTTITVAGDSGATPNNGGANDGGDHGLVVGDLVQLLGTGLLDGWYNVATVVSSSSYTLTSPNSGSFTAPPNAQVITAPVFTHSQLTGIAGGTKAVSNYLFPVTSSRLQLTAAGTTGVVRLAVLQGGLSS